MNVGTAEIQETYARKQEKWCHTTIEGNTIDCGVTVLYVMKQHYDQVPISKKPGSELPKMRIEILKTLLNWTKGKEYYTHQMFKRRRFH